MLIGLGLGLTDFGTRGGVADAADKKSLSLNFVTGVYTRNGVTYPDFATFLSSTSSTFTRASAGYDMAASSSFLTDVARITSAGLTYEAAATNIVLQSQTLEGYDGEDMGKTADQTAAPDGTMTAETFTEFTGTARHMAQQAITVSASQTYTYSQFFKNGDRRYVQLQASGTGDDSTLYAYADLQTGTITDAGATGTAVLASSSITAVGNGFYRIAVTGTLGASTTVNMTGALSDRPDHTTGTIANGSPSYLGSLKFAYCWGWQATLGALGSYIVTTTVPVTRAADALTLVVPTGLSTLTVTFDDDSTQQKTSATGSYLLPTNLNRPVVKSLAWAA